MNEMKKKKEYKYLTYNKNNKVKNTQQQQQG
jgi:hypothetical protein